MTNRLLSKSQMRRFAAQGMVEVAQLIKDCKKCQNPLLFESKHTCGAVKVSKKEPEDLTKLTDAALETRIFYSQDARAGEPFSPLFEEYKRRYNLKKKEIENLELQLLDYSEI